MNVMAKAETRLSNHYNKSRGSGNQAALSPALIALLVDLGKELLMNCLNKGNSPQQVAEDARRGGFLTRLAIRREMRASGLLRRRDTDEIMESLLGSAAESSAEELLEFAQEAN